MMFNSRNIFTGSCQTVADLSVGSSNSGGLENRYTNGHNMCCGGLKPLQYMKRKNKIFSQFCNNLKPPLYFFITFCI
jgi:hypothetical protein